MSLFNDLVGAAAGGQTGGGLAALIPLASELISKAGGVQGLLALLQQHGLGDAVQSWTGTGANQPVEGGQLGQALQGAGLGSIVQEAAAKLGVPHANLLSQLAQVLPQAVDHLTPAGQVPAQAPGSSFDMGSLASLAGKLLG